MKGSRLLGRLRAAIPLGASIAWPARPRRDAVKLLVLTAGALSVSAVALAGPAPAQVETLTGIATTTSGWGGGNCLHRTFVDASANFSASGSAIGPYSGQFTNTNASAGISGDRNPPWRTTLDIPFTLTSSTTTITGTITNPYPYMGGLGFICNASSIVGFEFGGNWATYSATIQPLGQAPEHISGHATAGATLYTTTGSQTTITETLALP